MSRLSVPTSHRRSSSRISRLSTQDVTSHSDSLRTVDKLSTAKPVLTHMDKLWTEIDVLDDVKQMSQQVREKGSFFNQEFDAELQLLKASQNRLLDVMRQQRFRDEETINQQQQLYHLNTADTSIANLDGAYEEPNAEQQAQQRSDDHKKAQQLNEFFDSNDDSTMLHRRTNFDELNQFIEDIRTNLDSVNNLIKKFDEKQQQMWNE